MIGGSCPLSGDRESQTKSAAGGRKHGMWQLHKGKLGRYRRQSYTAGDATKGAEAA
jgi:hypothetical protein